MKFIRNLLSVLLVILIIWSICILVIWGIYTFYVLQKNTRMPMKISSEAEQKRKSILVDYQNKKRELTNKYDREKYLATGKTVYDRIFNTPGQTIVELDRIQA